MSFSPIQPTHLRRQATNTEACSLHHHCPSLLLRSCLRPLVAIVSLLKHRIPPRYTKTSPPGQHRKNRHLPLTIQPTVLLLDLHPRRCNLPRPPSHRRRPLCNRLHRSGRKRRRQHHQGRSDPPSRGPGIIPDPLWRLPVRATKAQGAQQSGQEYARVVGVFDLDGRVHLDALHL